MEKLEYLLPDYGGNVLFCFFCYFLLNYNQFSSEFHFVLRLLVRSASFTLDYANTSTSLHNHLKARATNQVGFRRNNHDVEVFRFCQ